QPSHHGHHLRVVQELPGKPGVPVWPRPGAVLLPAFCLCCHLAAAGAKPGARHHRHRSGPHLLLPQGRVPVAVGQGPHQDALLPEA
ncbi:hypothetical protein HaLaN_25849, partial [Haematococcus lacustris]